MTQAIKHLAIALVLAFGALSLTQNYENSLKQSRLGLTSFEILVENSFAKFDAREDD